MNSTSNTLRKTSCKTFRHGYSMMELAIVLGVAGIVLGGLWATVDYVREKVKNEQMIEDIKLTVQNTRSYFMGQATLNNGGAGTITNRLLRATVIPPEMLRDRSAAQYVADHPWGPAAPDGSLIPGGGFDVIDVGQPATRFGVTIRGLKQDACAKLATQLGTASGPAGLISLSFNGSGTAETLPLTSIANALTKCGSSGAGSSIELIYNLRQQNS